VVAQPRAAVECLEQPGEERQYRHTTGLVYDTAMLRHECTCYEPANHLETAERVG
jgi:hypothetical protein